jgi:PAS domain S-box-containing protein
MQNIDFKGKILIIDDTVTIINMVKTALQEQKYQVLMATSDANGIKSAKKAQPDLILLDILMPEMDGYEICKRLKAEELTKEIPVIFMSALTEVFDKVKAFNLGAVDYVAKPLNIEELLARVNTQVTLYQMQKQLKDTNLWLEKEVEMRTLELKLSHEKYKTVAEFTHDWEYWILPNGQIKYMSPSCEKITGYTVNEFTLNPKLLYDIIIESDKLLWTKHLNAENDSDQIGEISFQIKTKDGRTIWIGHVSTKVYDFNGNFNGTRVSNRDITEVKEAENKLVYKNQEFQAAEEELKTANDTLKENIEKLYQSEHLLVESQRVGKVASWEYNFSLNKLTWSDEVFNMIGFKAKAFEPNIETYLEYIHPDDRALVDSAYQQSIINKSKAYEVEHRFIKFNSKEVIEVREIGENIFDEKGELFKTIGITIDITEQKQTERILKEKNEELQAAEEELMASNDELRNSIQLLTKSEAKLNAAQKLAKLGHYNLDISTGIWTSSQELDKIFGIDNTYNHNVEGWLSLIHPDFKQEMLDYFTNEVIGKQTSFNKEYKIVNQKTKKELWVHGLGELTIDSSGNLTKMLGSIQDITDRKTISEALKHQKDRLESIFKIAPTGIGLVKKRVIVEANTQVASITGYSLEDILGHSSRMLYPNDEEFERVGTYKYLQIEKFGTGVVETKWKRKDGGLVDILLASTPIDLNDLDKGVTFTALDITERKRAVEAVIESEQLFSSTLNDLLVGVVVHAPDTRIILSNPRAQEILGLSKDQMLGKMAMDPAWKFIREDGTDMLLENYPVNRVINSKKSLVNYVVGVSHPKRKNINWVIVNAIPIFAQANKLERVIVNFMDITKRKLAEIETEKAVEKLGQERDLLHALMDNIPDTIYFKDTQSRFTRINKAQANLIGVKTPNDAIGKTDFDFFMKEHAQQAYIDEQEIIKKGKLQIEKNEKIENPDGSIRWMSSTKVPVKDEKGNVNGLVGVSRDITKLIKTEQSLKESEERFAMAMNATNDGLFDWNLETNEIYFSPGWKKMIGYEDYEIENSFKAWEELTDQEDVASTLKKINDHIAGKTNRIESELKMRHKDGGWVNILSRGNAIFNKNGKATRLVGTHVDITESRKVEQAILEKNEALLAAEEELLASNDALKENIEKLSESETRFKALHNASFGGIAIHDKGIILECNHGLAELSGYSLNDLIGMDGLELIAEKSREMVMSKIAEGYDKPYEALGLRKNGLEYPLRLEAKNIPYKGVQVRVVEFRDITEQKEAERKLKESEERYRSFIANSFEGVSRFEFHPPLKLDWPLKKQIEHLYNNMIIAEANDSFAKMYGFNFGSEIVDHPISYIWGELDDASPAIESFIKNNYCFVNDETYEIDKDGNLHYFLNFGEPQFFENKLISLWITQIDITEQKEAERLIRENEERYRNLQENMQSGVAVYKPINNGKDFEIIDFNKAGEQISNIKREVVVGKKLSQIMPNLKESQVFKNIQQVYKTGKPMNMNANRAYDPNTPKYTDNQFYKLPNGEVVAIFEDVTQKVLDERLIKENEQQLQLIFDSSPAIMFLVNTKKEIVRMNKTGLEFFDTTMEDIQKSQTGDAFNCIVAIQGNKGCGMGYACKNCIIRTSLLEVINTQNQQNKLESKLNIIRNGKIESFTVLVSTSLATIEPETTFLITIDDITERNKTELELRASETRFRAIIESANDAIFISDAKSGEIVDVNRKGEELMGMSREIIIGMHQTELHPTDEKINMEINYQDDLRNPDKHTMRKVLIQHVSGKTIPVEVSPVLINLNDGNEYLVGFYRDITQRRKAELALIESESRFKLFVDVSNEGIVFHKNGIIIDVNPAFCYLSGYKEHELIGMNIFENIIPQKLHEIIKSYMSKGEGNYEAEIKTKNNNILQIAVKSRFISEKENLRVASVRDISIEKQVQHKILQAIINTEESERKRVAQELHDGLGPVLSTVKLYTETFLKSDNEAFKLQIKDQLLIGINEALQQVSTISNNLSPHVLDDFGLKAAIERFIDKLQLSVYLSGCGIVEKRG